MIRELKNKDKVNCKKIGSVKGIWVMNVITNTYKFIEQNNCVINERTKK